MDNKDLIWNQFLNMIKKRVSSLGYDTWFRDTKLVELSDDALSNQKYGVGLKNIEYVDTEILNSEMAGDDSVVSTIALENVSTDVRIKNNDATLSNIELSSGSLNETFDSDTIQYTANVDSSVDKISIQATANDGNAILPNRPAFEECR